MLDFVGRRQWFFLASAAVIVLGIVSLLIPPGLRTGIDFASGSTVTLVFSGEVSQADLRAELVELGYEDAIVQKTRKDAFRVETGPVSEADRGEIELSLLNEFGSVAVFAPAGQGGALTIVFGYPAEEGELAEALSALGYEGASIADATVDAFLVRTRTMDAAAKTELEASLRSRFGTLGTFDFYTVSPVIAGETVLYAMAAVAAAAIGILLYIAWAFRHVPSPFRYGVCAVVGLTHDVMIVIGIFSILGKFWGLEVNSMFITGLLTVIGYSVHNTIVVFDRIRENVIKGAAPDFPTAVNNSLLETLGRSLNTSLTLIFTLLALLLFGGVTIQNFVLVLFIGIVSGTYSSLFIASQLLVAWERGELRRLLRRGPARREMEPA